MSGAPSARSRRSRRRPCASGRQRGRPGRLGRRRQERRLVGVGDRRRSSARERRSRRPRPASRDRPTTAGGHHGASSEHAPLRHAVMPHGISCHGCRACHHVGDVTIDLGRPTGGSARSSRRAPPSSRPRCACSPSRGTSRRPSKRSPRPPTSPCARSSATSRPSSTSSSATSRTGGSRQLRTALGPAAADEPPLDIDRDGDGPLDVAGRRRRRSSPGCGCCGASPRCRPVPDDQPRVRQVVVEFVADRTGLPPTDMYPQLVGAAAVRPGTPR